MYFDDWLTFFFCSNICVLLGIYHLTVIKKFCSYYKEVVQSEVSNSISLSAALALWLPLGRVGCVASLTSLASEGTCGRLGEAWGIGVSGRSLVHRKSLTISLGPHGGSPVSGMCCPGQRGARHPAWPSSI